MPKPRTIKQTFDLQSCRDIVEMLHREIKRLKDSNNRPEAADHIFNCAMLGYHVRDWVWKDLQECGAANNRVRQEAGLPAHKETEIRHLWDVALRCADDSEKHALRVCQIICNTSKHGEDREDTNLEAHASAKGSEPPANTSITQSDPEWVWKFGNVDNRQTIVTEFERVYGFWLNFIHAYKIDRLSSVHNPDAL